jgi:hypothetical protein
MPIGPGALPLVPGRTAFMRALRRRRVRSLSLLLAGTGLAAACAVMEPPPGGPEDRKPPVVVSTIPAPDSAGIARDVTPVIMFSEKVDPASFKNRVFIYPPVEFDRLKVKGERLEIGFKGLLPETTICLLVRPGIRDYHRVESRQNYLFFFSTGDSIATGEISGVILFKGKPDTTGVAELFAARGDTTLDLRTAKRARVAFADANGAFALRALPADDSRWVLRAFTDRDGDARYSEGKEFAAQYPDTITLGPSHARLENVRITIIDPNEPGSIGGSIVNETVFDTLPTIRLAPARLGARALTARADSTGAFMLPGVPPGAYLLSAFIDIRVDTLCGTYFETPDTTHALDEPCVTLPDTIRLKPGEALTLQPITLR